MGKGRANHLSFAASKIPPKCGFTTHGPLRRRLPVGLGTLGNPTCGTAGTRGIGRRELRGWTVHIQGLRIHRRRQGYC
jgi:hypothetical protein